MGALPGPCLCPPQAPPKDPDVPVSSGVRGPEGGVASAPGQSRMRGCTWAGKTSFGRGCSPVRVGPGAGVSSRRLGDWLPSGTVYPGPWGPRAVAVLPGGARRHSGHRWRPTGRLPPGWGTSSRRWRRHGASRVPHVGWVLKKAGRALNWVVPRSKKPDIDCGLGRSPSEQLRSAATRHSA